MTAGTCTAWCPACGTSTEHRPDEAVPYGLRCQVCDHLRTEGRSRLIEYERPDVRHHEWCTDPTRLRQSAMPPDRARTRWRCPTCGAEAVVIGSPR